MLQRDDVRRPAQVNACFEGGSSRAAEIVAALRQLGLSDNQITVIDRPSPEGEEKREGITMVEPTFLERLKSLFGGGEHDEEEHKRYDLLILTHLGQDDALAGPVQEVFNRFNAARVNYYPMAEVDMHRLGEGASVTGSKLVPSDADRMTDEDSTTATNQAALHATGTHAPAVPASTVGGGQVAPGEIPPDEVTTIQVQPTEGQAGTHEEVVYRAESRVIVEDATGTTGGPTTGATQDPALRREDRH